MLPVSKRSDSSVLPSAPTGRQASPCSGFEGTKGSGRARGETTAARPGRSFEADRPETFLRLPATRSLRRAVIRRLPQSPADPQGPTAGTARHP